MLTSLDYIKALRDSKFLRFLEWPQGIVELFTTKSTPTSADDLLPLLVFEWLRNGFCLEDAKQFAVLYAVSNKEPTLLQGNLAYSLTTLYSAALQCLVYLNTDNGLTRGQIEASSKVMILQIMRQKETILNGKNLSEAQARFEEWSQTVDKLTVQKICSQMAPIVALRYTLLKYITEMSVAKSTENDALKITRLSLAKSCVDYLSKQEELTTVVIDEIAKYMKSIRASQPADFEMNYLNIISPLTLVDQTLRFMVEWSVRFFQEVKIPAAVAVTSSTDTVKSIELVELTKPIP